MAAQVVERLGLKSTAVHLDITSFHVDGAYDCADGDLVGKLQLVRGYSRDHRPVRIPAKLNSHYGQREHPDP